MTSLLFAAGLAAALGLVLLAFEVLTKWRNK